MIPESLTFIEALEKSATLIARRGDPSSHPITGDVV